MTAPTAVTPAPVTTATERFQDLLRTLFQLDFADLDFGIYRLFRVKAAEIEAFIGQDLPRHVDEAFASVETTDAASARERYGELRRRVLREIAQDALLPDGSVAPAYKAIPAAVIQDLVALYERARAAARANEATEAQKADVFNHLHAFFSRYYEDGDFVPRRRSGARADFVVPYRGEEVFFHWPTRGMHYVKTGEHFRDYRVTIDGVLGGPYSLRFELVEATVPRDNAKGDTRAFFPLPDRTSWDPDTRRLTLPFEYRLPTADEAARHGGGGGLQAGVLEESLAAVTEALAARVPLLAVHLTARESEDGPTWILRRLKHFTRRQRSDYFVFPGLRAFLEGELESYLKDMVLDLHDVVGDLPLKLRAIRVMREVGHRVVAFLDQIEQVQARLFEKPKWVLRTDWLVPIRHVPRGLWPEVLACGEQARAWVSLFGVPERVDDAFLKTHPTLVLDTRHFGDDFRRRLMDGLHGTVGPIGDATDGILIHGENYQALRLLEPTLGGRVKAIYIDPPYNTGNDGFVYKDRYQHATWLTMMEERLRLARTLMSRDGACFISIDDREVSSLQNLTASVFGQENQVAGFIWRKVDSPNDNKVAVTPDHEYVLCVAADGASLALRRKEDATILEAYGQVAEDGRRYRDRLLKKNGKSSLREDRPKSWFPIPGPDGVDVWPVHDDGREARWSAGWEGVQELISEGRIIWKRRVVAGREQWVPYTREFAPAEPFRPFPTIWNDLHTMRQAQAQLKDMGLAGSGFDTPKPTALVARILDLVGAREGWVLDFFAGSGVTAHATIDGNRADGGARRFAVVEMATYFDTIVLQRVARAMYAPAWKDGLPTEDPAIEPLVAEAGDPASLPEWIRRSPRLVKVLRLESYDDALQNLAASAEGGRDAVRAQGTRDLAGDERYRLRYLFQLPLDASDTRPNLEKLEHPFGYSLEVLTDDGPRQVPIDVVETANLLLGLSVERYETLEGPDGAWRAVHARKDGERWLVLWRDAGGSDEAEKAFLLPRIGGYDRVLINGGSATPGVDSVDVPLFAAMGG